MYRLIQVAPHRYTKVEMTYGDLSEMLIEEIQVRDALKIELAKEVKKRKSAKAKLAKLGEIVALAEEYVAEAGPVDGYLTLIVAGLRDVLKSGELVAEKSGELVAKKSGELVTELPDWTRQG